MTTQEILEKLNLEQKLKTAIDLAVPGDDVLFKEVLFDSVYKAYLTLSSENVMQNPIFELQRINHLQVENLKDASKIYPQFDTMKYGAMYILFAKILIAASFNESFLERDDKLEMIELIRATIVDEIFIRNLNDDEEAMNYINEQEKFLSEKEKQLLKEKSIENKSKEILSSNIIGIRWTNEQALTKLSVALFERGITKSKNDFRNFINGKSATLSIDEKQIKTFVWLIDTLHKKPYKLYTITGSSKGHFKYFQERICRFSNSDFKSVSFKDIASKIRRQTNLKAEPITVTALLIKEMLDTKKE